MLPAKEYIAVKGIARLKVWGLILLGALLMTASHPPLDIPYIGLVAFAPILLALPRMRAGGAWLAGVLTGFVFWGVNIFWLSDMVTEPGTAWIIYGMYALGVCIMTTPFSFAFMGMRWALTRQAFWPWLLVPVIWLGMDFVNEFNTPAPFPWLPAGTGVLSFDWLMQTADLWGGYGLTMLVVFVGAVLANVFRLEGKGACLKVASDKRSRILLPVVAILLLAACNIYGAVRLTGIEDSTRKAPRLGSVQGNLSQVVKERKSADPIRESAVSHFRLTKEAVDANADMIVWAETMVFYGASREGFNRSFPDQSRPYFTDGVPDKRLLKPRFVDAEGHTYSAQYVEYLRAHIAHRWKTPMLVGVLTDVPEDEQIHKWKDYSYRRHNAAMMFDEQGRIAGIYDKRFLVPGGEYVPWEDFEIAGWRPVRDLIVGYAEGLQGKASYVEPGQNLTVFKLQTEDESYRYTSSICYEYGFTACYVDLARAAGETPPDFHINISNEGWFKESAELDQAVNFCRLRCIETRVPMLHTTNTGVTCAIDARGHVIRRLEVDGKDREVQGLMMVDLPILTKPTQTIFIKYIGRAPGYISMFVTLAVFVLMLVGRLGARRNKKLSKKHKQIST